MKYTIIINENDNKIIPQMELLESLGHTVEIIEIDTTSSLIVDIDQPCEFIGQHAAKVYVNWKNYNALNFFAQ